MTETVNGKKLIRWNTPEGQQMLQRINSMAIGSKFQMHYDAATGISAGILTDNPDDPHAEQFRQAQESAARVEKEELARSAEAQALIETNKKQDSE